MSRKRIKVEGIAREMVAWRQRHVDVILVGMLLGDIIGDIGKGGETIGLVFGSSQRSRYEVTSNFVHLQSMISFFNQSRQVLSLLAIELGLSLLLCFSDEVQKWTDLFLHDLLSDVIILRLDVLSERFLILDGNRCVSTSTAIGLWELMMERKEVSF